MSKSIDELKSEFAHKRYQVISAIKGFEEILGKKYSYNDRSKTGGRRLKYYIGDNLLVLSKLLEIAKANKVHVSFNQSSYGGGQFLVYVQDWHNYNNGNVLKKQTFLGRKCLKNECYQTIKEDFHRSEFRIL